MKRKRLVYRMVPHNGGAVFAEPERAELVARLHKAIGTAATWGDLRKAVPPTEYSKIIGAFDSAGVRRPKGADHFEPEAVAGWSDGDYPPWLQLEMEAVIPVQVLRQFGSLNATHLNGTYWAILSERVPAMCRALRNAGWDLRHRPDLQFF